MLNGLLEQLDRIDSHGDAEVREKRKEVVKAVESALEEVECADGEAVEKRLSLAAPVSAVEQVDTPVAVGNVAPEQSTPVQSEAAAVSMGDSPPAQGAILWPSTPIVSDDATTILPVESSLN